MTGDFEFRPLARWPYPETPLRRSSYIFKASWSQTMSLLARELRQLDGDDAIIAAGFRQEDIRRDGLPKAAAWAPAFPGVEISFSVSRDISPSGRLVYATDVVSHWQGNVRSIALGLQALRAVDRYGITRRNEQYAGFAALPPGGPDADRGRRIVNEHSSVRDALFATHPDHGGNVRDFADVQAYREAGRL